MPTSPHLPRRDFLKLAGAAAVATTSSGTAAAFAVQTIHIVVDPTDAMASSAPVTWAAQRR
jgi:hypothetical protein